MKKHYSALFIAFVAAVFVGCSSQGPDSVDSEAGPRVSEIGDSGAVYVLFSGQTASRSDWHDEVTELIGDNDNAEVQGVYYNLIDSMLVYMFAKASTVEVAEELENSLNELENASSEEVRLLTGKKDIDLYGGYGDDYIMVSHPVKDFDKWYQTFAAMYQVKELDSIYTLGVFADVERPEYVSVFVRTVSFMKASRYGDNLEKSELMDASGVYAEPDALVLRLWSFKK